MHWTDSGSLFVDCPALLPHLADAEEGEGLFCSRCGRWSSSMDMTLRRGHPSGGESSTPTP